MAGVQVAIVTTSGCKFCKRAKEALKANDILYNEIEVQGDVELLATFREASGRRTVPQIFVEGKCFGGSDELVSALEDGTFQKLLASATLPPLTDSLQAAVVQAAARREAEQQAAAASAEPSSSRAELDAVVARMAGPEGIPRKAHTSGFLFKTTQHAPSFTAQAASEWLVSTSPPNTFASPQDTYSLLARLQAANLIFDTSQTPGGPDPPAPSPLTPTQQFALTSEALKPHYGKPLNTHYPWYGPARPATQVAAELRALILELYDKYLSEDGKAVSYRKMGQDPLWQRFVDTTAELQKVDLAPLNREELMALFINLYNVVVIHATVAHGAPATSLDRAKFFTTGAKYMVAGQEYSTDDMEHGVLRGNQAAPLSFLKKHQFSSSDPRSKKVVTPMDQRIHFALVCGAKSCPPIKVYTPESLEEGLQGAAEAFCASEVSLDPQERTATLSKIFQWYGKDFGEGDQQLLKALGRYLEASRKVQLEQMLSTGPVKVAFKPYDWSLNSE